MRERRGGAVGAAVAAVAALLLCLLAFPAQAAPPPPPPPLPDDGIVCYKGNASGNASDLPGFERAMEDADMQPLYMSSLLPDIAYWSSLAQQRGHNFTVPEIMQQIKRLLWSPYIGIIIIQDGISYRFKPTRMLTFALYRLMRFQKALKELHASGAHIPDTMIIFNAEDVPVCHRLMGCRVPVFSLFKRLRHSATQSSAAAGPSSSSSSAAAAAVGVSEPFQDEEVLLPNFNQDWDRLCFYPWEKKNATALMRASLQMTMGPESSRYILAMLSNSSAAAAQLLDVGIIQNNSTKVKLGSQHMRHYLGMRKHCRWRFLLNTDGHTASSRMGHLLGLNSVVVKERSDWVEYYYRALQPGRDHVEFEPQTVLQLVQELKAPGRDAEMQRIATAGQRFAFKYLHTRAKALYARQAIIQYNKLFKGLEEFVQLLPLKNNTYIGRHPPSLKDLISYMSDITGVDL